MTLGRPRLRRFGRFVLTLVAILCLVVTPGAVGHHPEFISTKK